MYLKILMLILIIGSSITHIESCRTTISNHELHLPCDHFLLSPPERSMLLKDENSLINKYKQKPRYFPERCNNSNYIATFSLLNDSNDPTEEFEWYISTDIHPPTISFTIEEVKYVFCIENNRTNLTIISTGYNKEKSKVTEIRNYEKYEHPVATCYSLVTDFFDQKYDGCDIKTFGKEKVLWNSSKGDEVWGEYWGVDTFLGYFLNSMNIRDGVEYEKLIKDYFEEDTTNNSMSCFQHFTCVKKCLKFQTNGIFSFDKDRFAEFFFGCPRQKGRESMYAFEIISFWLTVLIILELIPIFLFCFILFIFFQSLFSVCFTGIVLYFKDYGDWFVPACILQKYRFLWNLIEQMYGTCIVSILELFLQRNDQRKGFCIQGSSSNSSERSSVTDEELEVDMIEQNENVDDFFSDIGEEDRNEHSESEDGILPLENFNEIAIAIREVNDNKDGCFTTFQQFILSEDENNEPTDHESHDRRDP